MFGPCLHSIGEAAPHSTIMNTHRKPWESGPAELIRYAVKHLHGQSEADQHIAFLLLDVGVETLFKTFLLLPDSVTGAATDFFVRKKAANGSFHDLVKGVEAAARHKLQPVNLDHVQFYHDIRNKLYHDGTGITVATENVNGYAHLAVALLEILLDVDITDELMKPEIEARIRSEREAAIVKEREELQEEIATIADARRRLEAVAAEAIERVCPPLALRGFERRFKELVHQHTNSGFQNTHDFDRAVADLIAAYGQGAAPPISTFSDNLTEVRLDILKAALMRHNLTDTFNSEWAGLYHLSKLFPMTEEQPELSYGDDGEVIDVKHLSHEEIISRGRKWESDLKDINKVIEDWLYQQYQSDAQTTKDIMNGKPNE